MQGIIPPYASNYASNMGQEFIGHQTAKGTVDSAAISAQPCFGTPVLAAHAQNASPPSDVDLQGQVCAIQLPGSYGTPTHTAWCSVSNLVAVALTPDPRGSAAQILVLEPSTPEDCTALELPLSGPGDFVSSLEWSWPGQRRALLTATASGRVVVWTQPSQQGQDDTVLPRSIDDWQGQLLLDLEAGAHVRGTTTNVAGAAAGANHHQQQHHLHLKQEPGSRPGGAVGGSSSSPYVKPDPGTEPQTGADVQMGSPGSIPKSPVFQHQHQPQHNHHHPQTPPCKPALAAVCWLRQPASGRFWSTSSLALKRLDGQPLQPPSAYPHQHYQQHGDSRGGAGTGGGLPENFDSVFSEEGPAAGAVPHWARPHQLTIAVLTASGSLTILWSLASKLPNTLSWWKSKSLRIPLPPRASAASGADSGADTGADAEWSITSASMCAVQDGTLAVAVVYGKRCDTIYLYGMRGNPTLAGQPVSSQPGASVSAAAAGCGASSREAPQPTLALMAALAMPQGLLVRQCHFRISGGATSMRMFALTQPAAAATGAGPAYSSHGWPAARVQTHAPSDGHTQPAAVLCFTEAADVDSGWRVERTSPQLEPIRGGGGVAAATATAMSSSTSAAAATGATPAPVPGMSVSVEGSKIVVAHGSFVYSLDAETLAVLSVHDIAHALAPADTPGGARYGDKIAATARPDLALPSSGASPTVLGSAAALSSTSCCVCTVARLASEVSEGSVEDELDGDDGGDVVVLSIHTVPDVVPPPSTSGSATGAGGVGAAYEGMADSIACNLDTLRLAWGILHRLSLWDVGERLRATWLAGRQEHVVRSVAQLDGLMYGHDDCNVRMALAPGITRAKLEVLRRLPHPQASLLAADLLAAARMIQYCQSLQQISQNQTESLANEETRTVAAHMVWFVAEAHTLMLAGLKLWAESEADAAARGGERAGAEKPDGADGVGSGSDPSSTDPGMLPLIRLVPDYSLYKHAQLSLFGSVPSRDTGKAASEARPPVGLGWNPVILELLGGNEMSNRLKMIVSAFKLLNTLAMKALTSHIQALQKQQEDGLLPELPLVALSPAELENASKSVDLPRALMQRALPSLFPGPFHFHYTRCKGVLTPQLLTQWFRQQEVMNMSKWISLSRETILERYRALGLQAALMDRRSAPHLADRKLWMSFRAPAPPPEVHSHVLTQHVSVRQRQRWRRQRAAGLALSSSAPLWSHVEGSLVDCLTGVPLPPGTPWSLEGASAVGAVTSQIGPGAARRNPPPLLAAVQRAWVGCAPPTELGSLWKRARLGLEQDMEY